ncbi:hypothetical protein L227DRAFT_68602 [Lentinus tigrinus ALCF2SS1-6]|uniref:Uncharacterized protein n=1 Tax=Lentinus tigrinus ALCF2SS1-6 TaxID=1328759 RepID=A0A5C2SE06_9APHY|nr:hypothetical protein L227DRAFT_68602 [Lentinus tigrinus ALCF2SS1-6]
MPLGNPRPPSGWLYLATDVPVRPSCLFVLTSRCARCEEHVSPHKNARRGDARRRGTPCQWEQRTSRTHRGRQPAGARMKRLRMLHFHNTSEQRPPVESHPSFKLKACDAREPLRRSQTRRTKSGRLRRTYTIFPTRNPIKAEREVLVREGCC